MNNEIEVCKYCGKNGDETLITIGARIYGEIDKNGYIEWDNYIYHIDGDGLINIVFMCQECEVATGDTDLIPEEQFCQNKERLQAIYQVLDNKYHCLHKDDPAVIDQIELGYSNDEIILSFCDKYDIAKPL